MIRTLLSLILSQKRRYSLSLTQTTKHTGWTLFEIMVVIIILGILISLIIPNLMGLMGKSKAQNALWQVKGALQEAQRNAIKRGKSCRIVMMPDVTPTSFATASDSDYLGCLNSSGINFDGLNIRENFPGQNINFSYKGNTTNLGTIVIESSNASTKYCLVVSNLLGVIRSGIYEAPQNDTSVSASYCKSLI